MRGGSCSQFSDIVYQGYGASYADIAKSLNMSQPLCEGVKFAKRNKQLFLLSDGQCGSACSFLSRGLQDGKYATSIVVGGIPNTPQQVASFGGGEVWDQPTIDTIGPVLSSLTKSSMPVGWPGTLPYQGQQFRFVPREVRDIELQSTRSMVHPGIPAEFVFEPANIRMSYTISSTQWDATLYQEATARIKECADGKDCSWCQDADPKSVNSCKRTGEGAPCCDSTQTSSLTGFASCGAKSQQACPIKPNFCSALWDGVNGTGFSNPKSQLVSCFLGLPACNKGKPPFPCECSTQVLTQCMASSDCSRDYFCKSVAVGPNFEKCPAMTTACAAPTLSQDNLILEDVWQEK